MHGNAYDAWTMLNDFELNIQEFCCQTVVTHGWFYLKPTKNGRLSDKTYNQGDCKVFRFQRLSFVFHNQPMGRDTGDIFTPKKTEWEYPSPGTVSEAVLKQVCSR